MGSKRHILFIIILSQFAGTSLWFAGNAVLPELQNIFHIEKHAVSQITAAVQLGFIAGTFVFALLSIADRFSPSKVFFASSLIAALANISVIFTSEVSVMITLRFLTGFFLAGIYPVGMKIAADWFDKELGKALGYLVGALVLGTAFPHLLKGDFSLPWKNVLVTTSVFATIGGILILLFVNDGPFRRRASGLNPSALLTAFRVVNFRSAAFGYFGHMWELYTLWAFIPMIILLHNHLTPTLNVPLISFLAISVGGLGCVIGGWLSRKAGSAWIAFVALLISGICCLVSPFIIRAPNLFFIPFLIIWGITIAADSPQFSALVAATAPPDQRGSALTFVISIGFAITILSIFFIDHIIPYFESPAYVFPFLALGPALGLVSMLPLIRNRNR